MTEVADAGTLSRLARMLGWVDRLLPVAWLVVYATLPVAGTGGRPPGLAGSDTRSRSASLGSRARVGGSHRRMEYWPCLHRSGRAHTHGQRAIARRLAHRADAYLIRPHGREWARFGAITGSTAHRGVRIRVARRAGTLPRTRARGANVGMVGHSLEPLPRCLPVPGVLRGASDTGSMVGPWCCCHGLAPGAARAHAQLRVRRARGGVGARRGPPVRNAHSPPCVASSRKSVGRRARLRGDAALIYLATGKRDVFFLYGGHLDSPSGSFAAGEVGESPTLAITHIPVKVVQLVSRPVLLRALLSCRLRRRGSALEDAARGPAPSARAASTLRTGPGGAATRAHAPATNGLRAGSRTRRARGDDDRGLGSRSATSRARRRDQPISATGSRATFWPPRCSARSSPSLSRPSGSGRSSRASAGDVGCRKQACCLLPRPPRSCSSSSSR